VMLQTYTLHQLDHSYLFSPERQGYHQASVIEVQILH